MDFFGELEKLPQNSISCFEIHNKRLQSLCRQCAKNDNQEIDKTNLKNFIKKRITTLTNIHNLTKNNHTNLISKSDLKNELLNSDLKVCDNDIEIFMNHVDKDLNDEWLDFLILCESNSIHKIFKESQMLFFNDSGDVDILQVHPVKELNLNFLLAGGLAGAVSRTATAPLDRIRVLLQTSTTVVPNNKILLKNAGPSSGSSILDAIRKIYAMGGITSFYRGNFLNILKVFPESAIKFWVFETSKDHFFDQKNEDLNITERFLCGGLAGLISQFLIYPLETLKIRLMTEIHQNTPPKPGHKPINTDKNTFKLMQKIYREGGMRHFYRGCSPSLWGIMPYAGIDLACYETLKNRYCLYLREHSLDKGVEVKIGILPTLGFGMVSGTVGATTMYPVSVIRTRMQAQGSRSHPELYDGVLDCFRKTLAKEGVKGFYKGLVPTLMKVVPSVSISYAVYDFLK